MRKILLMLGVCACMLAAGCGQVKVGYIDESKIVDAPQIKAITDEGNAKMQEVQQELVKKLEENPNMTAEDAEKAQMEAQRKAMGYSQQYLTQVQQKLNVALAEIVKEKDLDAVMENGNFQKSVVVGGIDVTEEVIKKLQ